jgi:hypothetical protein
MEWIKAKYDRLLLGVFGVIAILLGGLLTMKALGFKKTNFPRREDPEIRVNFGTDDAGKKIEAAKTGLAEVVEIKEPVKDEHPIDLFVSTPILKKAGSTEEYGIYTKPDLREGIPNKWFYDNDLDITRQDIAEMDTDGDGFTNREEYNGGTASSNPNDAKSMPAPYSKVKYVETVSDPMTLLFSLALSDTEASIKRTEPAELKWTKTIKVGEEFSSLKDGDEKRFKLEALKKVQKAGNEEDAAVIEDSQTKQKFDLVRAEPKQMPTTRAKLISSLVKADEKTVSVGDEFTFEAAPEQHYKVVSIDVGEIVLETWAGADGKKETIKLPISSAP